MPRARKSEAAEVFVPGQLSYLPKRRDGEILASSGSEVPDGCFDHPVVILSTDQRKKLAVVLILTSFGGKSFDEYSPRIRAFHLPVHPSPVHPDNGVLLFLDQGLELRKKTYVKTQFQRSVPWALLQADYREQKRAGKPYRLRADSFARLLEHINLEAPVEHRNSIATSNPLRPSIEQPHGRDLRELMKAYGLERYSSINQPTLPPSRIPEPPRYSIRAPIAASTPQSVARTREGTASDVNRYLAQWREARRHETRSILPTYRTSPPRSDLVVSSHDSMRILRRLFVVLLVMGGVSLTIAWWQCQLWVCK